MIVEGRVLIAAAGLIQTTGDRPPLVKSRGGENAVELLGAHHPTLMDAAQLGGVLGLFGGGASLVEGRQKQADEQSDDGHDDQQLDEGETTRAFHCLVLRCNVFENDVKNTTIRRSIASAPLQRRGSGKQLL